MTVSFGAGAAGLAAGQVLKQAGKRVVVLEAKHRVAGRIWSAYPWNDDLRVEWGAEFVHDCADVEKFWPQTEWPRSKVAWDGRFGQRQELRYCFDGNWITWRQYTDDLRLRKAIDEDYIERPANPHASVADTVKRWPMLARKVATSGIEGMYGVAPTRLSAAWTWSGHERWGGDFKLVGP